MCVEIYLKIMFKKMCALIAKDIANNSLENVKIKNNYFLL